MMTLKKILQLLYSVYAMICFVLIMLVLFPFVIIASFFGRIRGGNMIFRLCMVWADLWFPMIGIFHRKIYESPHDRSRPYIFVSNHISYIDSAFLPVAFRQPVRPLGKVEMGRIPVFGFIYRKAIVTVDRTSPENRAQSIRILKSVISKKISVLVFPEGTFNMTDQPLKSFYDGAFKVAIETQTPVKPVLFPDTNARMDRSSVLKMSPGRNRVIYLPEISVEGLTTDDVAALRDKVYLVMANALIKYKADWIK